MKIGPYTVSRHDERNIVVNKSVKRVAKSDTKHHKAGEEYEASEFIGYYPSLTLACNGILKNSSLDVDGKGYKEAIAALIETTKACLKEIEEDSQ